MGTLRVGAARMCITPPLGTHLCGFFSDRTADDVLDDLYAKAVVFENGETCVAVVACDLIAAFKTDFDRARARAAALSGIPQDNIFFCCTHTHYGPSSVSIFNVPREDAYMEWAMDRAGDAVKLAFNRLRRARIGHARADCPEEVHNRRWHMKDGTVQMNPGYRNPDALRPAGPVDPEIGLLVALDEVGTPIAVLANYALHYVGGPYATSVSADYFGEFDRALQRMAGAEFVGIMLNGCCGDINNCDFTQPAPTYPNPFYQARRVANVVASRAFGAWQQIREFDDNPKLEAAAVPMRFRRREPSPGQLAAARKLRAREENSNNRDWIYAGELLAVHAEPVEQDTLIRALRLGDTGLVGLPGEIFVEIGLAVKSASPAPCTFTAELANDYLGYIPTDQALAEGSYETQLARSAKAAPGMADRLIEACSCALQKLWLKT
ncbi:MAG: hypothetical protein GXP31_09570 [Kiritimatiellaeota bacterium]|nr:hypothetical protein [Kiritimatiellota bacterium]